MSSVIHMSDLVHLSGYATNATMAPIKVDVSFAAVRELATPIIAKNALCWKKIAMVVRRLSI